MDFPDFYHTYTDQLFYQGYKTFSIRRDFPGSSSLAQLSFTNNKKSGKFSYTVFATWLKVVYLGAKLGNSKYKYMVFFPAQIFI